MSNYGTPAPRAPIIEKLKSKGYITNEKNKMEPIKRRIKGLRNSVEKNRKKVINFEENIFWGKLKEADPQGKIEITAMFVMAVAKGIAAAKGYPGIFTDTFKSIIERVAPLSEIDAWATRDKEAPDDNRLNKLISDAKDLFEHFLCHHDKMEDSFGGLGDDLEVEYLINTNKSLKQFLFVANKYPYQDPLRKKKNK